MAGRPTVCSGTMPRRIVTTLYYLAILLALVLLYGRGDVPTAGFIYQNF